MYPAVVIFLIATITFPKGLGQFMAGEASVVLRGPNCYLGALINNDNSDSNENVKQAITRLNNQDN